MATLTDRELLRLYVNDPDSENSFFDNYKLDRLIADAEGDLNSAAAQAWLIKAAHVNDWYNVGVDGAELSRGQVWTHCMRMADVFQSSSSGTLTDVALKTDYFSEEANDASELA